MTVMTINRYFLLFCFYCYVFRHKEFCREIQQQSIQSKCISKENDPRRKSEDKWRRFLSNRLVKNSRRQILFLNPGKIKRRRGKSY